MLISPHEIQLVVFEEILPQIRMVTATSIDAVTIEGQRKIAKHRYGKYRREI
jgi:hypothetical protein